jgi:hypothetical protein
MKLAITAAACALCAAGSAHAVTYTYGTLLSGSGAPASATFATLTANVVGNDVQFTLDAFGLDLLAGSTPFIGALAIDGSGAGTSVSGISGGVSTVSLASGGGPGGSFDFRFRLGGGQDRLVDNEQVSWTWVGGAGKYTDIALHVQGIDYGATTSAWYVPTPVPEPETYALMAAGLAVVAGLTRRRRPD